MEKVKQFLTTKTTQKGVWTCLAVPFVVVCAYVFLGKMSPADFHEHLSSYSKWVMMSFLFSKAALDGASVIKGGQ